MRHNITEANDKTRVATPSVALVFFLSLFFVAVAGCGHSSPNVAAVPENSASDNSASSENQAENQEETATETRSFTKNDPFNRTLAQAPHEIEGNDFMSVYGEISRRRDEIEQVLAKSEFETEDEYRARFPKELRNKDKTLFGDVRFGDDVAFFIFRSGSTPENALRKWTAVSFDSTYDIEQSYWTLEIRFPAPFSYSDGLGRVPLFSQAISKARSMGGRAVPIAADSVVGLLTRGSFSSSEDAQTFKCVLTSVPVEAAKSATENLAALCVFTPLYAPVEERHESGDDASSELESRLIACENVEFWFFDRETGEIFVKLRLEELTENPSLNFQKTREAARMKSDASSQVAASDAQNELVDAIMKALNKNPDDDADNSNVGGNARNALGTSNSRGNNRNDDELTVDDDPSVKYETVPLDDSVNALPPDYRGHNPAAIVKGLTTDDFSNSDITYKRDSRQYLAAVLQKAQYLQDKPLFGSIRFDSRLAYVFPNDSENTDPSVETVMCEYDAAKKVMVVHRSFRNQKANGARWRAGTYPPMAAYFGLKERNRDVFALALEFNQTKKKTSSQMEHWTVTGVEQEQYENLKNTLRLACVFNLGLGGNQYVGYFKPVSGPRDATPYYLICAANPEFWLFDGATGEIVAKYSAADTFNGKRVKIGETALSEEDEE